MLTQIAWRNVRANPVRFLGTVLAVVLATTFLSAALTARDSLSDSLESNAVAALDEVDLAVDGFVDEDSPGAQFESPPGVPVDVVADVAAVDGVAEAIGQASGDVELPGLVADSPTPATGWVVVDSPLTPWSIAEGRLPAAAGEIAVDEDTARELDLAVGAPVAIATISGPLEATVVGLSTYGDVAARELRDVLVSAADGDVVADLSSSGWDIVLVDFDDDADIDAATTQVDALADDAAESLETGGFEVLTGDELRDREAGQAASLASGLGIGLQVFAYLALVIGALIIFNTFTTVVAQRTREFALLRAIGTSARQVRRAVRLEALVVAVVSSAIGTALGAGLIALAIAVIPAVGNFANFSMRPLSIVQVMVSGIVVTMVSAFIPAWRASRTRPVEAMRDADPTVKPVSRIRGLIGMGAMAVGALALAIGSAIDNWWAMGAGSVLLFIGVLVAGPTLVSLLARVLRRPLARLSIADELAVAEADRNARRTAATANALVIGVFLVVFATSAGGALRDFAVDQIGELSGADVSVASFTGQPLDEELVTQVTEVDGLVEVAQVNSTVGFGDLDIGFGQQLPVAGVDMDAFGVLGVDVIEGAVDSEGLAVAEELATGAGIALGDIVTVEFLNGEQADLEVTALTGFSFDIPPANIDLALARELSGDDLPVTSLAAQYAPDADQDQVTADVEAITSQYAGIDLIDTNQFVTLIRTFFNFLLSAVSALLGVAIVIALFGILNTLVLAIAERTRELGLLRSVGMTRRQLRRMIRTEAVITSMVGTTIGAVLGLAISFAIIRVALEGAFSWPWLELAVTMVAGVVTGVVASLFPAWRAARMNALEAIRTE
ncbi:MAG TPA: FtsX-like permease family protein [Nitriliruptoraceae bacterium]|nr:FtsX-like permease family protein [Nitriliruptoraceae bacterium]